MVPLRLSVKQSQCIAASKSNLSNRKAEAFAPAFIILYLSALQLAPALHANALLIFCSCNAFYLRFISHQAQRINISVLFGFRSSRGTTFAKLSVLYLKSACAESKIIAINSCILIEYCFFLYYGTWFSPIHATSLYLGAGAWQLILQSHIQHRGPLRSWQWYLRGGQYPKHSGESDLP